MKTYKTRQEAQDAIDKHDVGTYYLAHGEYARPVYTARKVIGDDTFYIHVRYYYYAGTFNARKSGAADLGE